AMAGQNLAQPLEQQWTAWEAEDPQASGEFLPAAMKEVTWKDVRYGIPMDIYTLVLLYNRDHFDEVGLPYPEADYSLADLHRAAQMLTQPEKNRYGLGLTTDPWYVYAWISGAGGDVVTGSPETGYNLTLDSNTNIDAITFLSSLVEEGSAP